VLAVPSDAPLSAAERFALDVLIDLSAVLRCDGAGDVVQLRVVDGLPLDSASPALRAHGWGIVPADGAVAVERALLRFVVDVAGAEGEQRSTAGDRFRRVPAADTRAVRESIEREPVVSLAAVALARAVRAAAGRRVVRFVDPWPAGHRWAAALTHDLDVVEWWPAFTLLRLAELARHGELVRAARVAVAALASAARPVVWSAIRELLAIEASHGIRSSWFVLCGEPTLASVRAGDLTYRPDGASARRILRAVRDGGHEIGLHGSFRTSEDHPLFVVQREMLRAIAGVDVVGVRQHYLRMRPATTPRGMRDAGFAYDSTFGFADRNGFRLGVADVVPLWDAERQALVGLDEAPFTWMDRALSKYQHVEAPGVWIDDALALADRCHEVQGLWVGIWHPNLTPALGFPDAPIAYARLASELVTRGAYVAPLGELVAWRRARRALRALDLREDGQVRLAASASAGADTSGFVVRDGDGRQDVSLGRT
jgi:peptidoglycan/xylan/chitin deacetylase (PgdA/CDA1 family)